MHITRTSLLALAFFLSAGIASAHSTVSPINAETSSYQTFTLSVPTERDVPTTKVVLLIPPGLEKVTPFVKPGWNIQVMKNGQGTTTQVEWTGGSIPAGLKDVFEFTAATPAKPTTLIWKVYQTYQNGETVAWDQDPKAGDDMKMGDAKAANPYSETSINDSAATAKQQKNHDALPLILSVVALVLALGALAKTRSKN